MLQDVVVNLAAGLAVFVLDVVLVVWLLPKVLHRRLEARWMPTRIAFAERATESYLEIVSSLSRAIREEYWNEPVKIRAAQSLKDEISFFIVALDPEMTAIGARYLRSTEQVLEGIESVRYVFLKTGNGALDQTWKMIGAGYIDELKQELAEQDRLMRALRGHVRLREPVSDANLQASIRCLNEWAAYFAGLPDRALAGVL